MESAQLLMGMKAVSWLLGFIVFYLLSPMPKAQRKHQIQEVSAHLINFVLFIWLGKLLLNFPRFIENPLAVLAYPSNASAFYLAVLFTLGTVIYKMKKEKVDLPKLLEGFIYVFLVASFIYEFMQIIWQGTRVAPLYFILIGGLIFLQLFLQNRLSANQLVAVLLIGWGAGTLALSVFTPYVIVFGYTIAQWFLLLVLLSGIVFYIVQERKRVL